MIQLGSDAAGSAVRARLQSASLLSDMESFKAANPGCELGDFVRWHSPRDWSEEAGLSHRMRCPGNVWAELWDQARVVPAARQRRLWDDTREAEKVLSLLTGLGPGDLAQLLLPSLLHAGLARLDEARHDLPDLEPDPALLPLLARLASLPCLPEVRHYRGQVQDPQFQERRVCALELGRALGREEARISRALSLRKKFLYDLMVAEDGEAEDAQGEMERFVSSLGRGGEVRVVGAARGPAGRLIQGMFRESQQEEWPRESGLPPPVTKQFIVRTTAARPFPYSRPGPQRMFVKLGPQGEFRVAGCFTADRQYS